MLGAQLSCTYDAFYVDMVGFARLECIRIIAVVAMFLYYLVLIVIAVFSNWFLA